MSLLEQDPPKTLVLVPTAFEVERLFPDLSVPTHGAVERIDAVDGTTVLAIVGFGMAAAGVSSALLIERVRPKRCLHVGIAGSYDVAAAPLGSVIRATDVASHGIGVGEGALHQGPTSIGFPQLVAEPERDVVYDLVAIQHWMQDAARAVIPGRVLTVTSAAASLDEARARRTLGFGAIVEDMESFAVALACHATAVPLEILRGVSNAVGERNKSRWKIDDALLAVRSALVAACSQP